MAPASLGRARPRSALSSSSRPSAPLITELAGRTDRVRKLRSPPAGDRASSAAASSPKARSSSKGQPLYQIDPSLYRAVANQAQANLASAQAQRRGDARIKADRYKPLAADAGGRQAGLYRRRRRRAPGRRAGRSRTAPRSTPRRSTCASPRVPAPITGRIGRSLFTDGALVTASQTDPLTTIQRLDPIYVDIQQSSGRPAARCAARWRRAARVADQRRGAAEARGRQRLWPDRHGRILRSDGRSRRPAR